MDFRVTARPMSRLMLTLPYSLEQVGDVLWHETELDSRRRAALLERAVGLAQPRVRPRGTTACCARGPSSTAVAGPLFSRAPMGTPSP